jgi:hypothetical protein
MATPPPQETPEEEEVKSRITNMWWLENELRTLDMRAQKALAALALGTQDTESVRTHEYAKTKDEKVTMIRMQKGMTVSKAGTEALAAVVTANQCIYTEECWMEKMRETSEDREEFEQEVSIARAAELAEDAGAGRVYVVMGEPKAVRNAFKARILLWRARDETRKEILPDGTAAPTERTAKDLNTIVGSWLQHGELSIIAKRQSANNVAYGKRVRTDRVHPWVVTMTLSDAKADGRPWSFGKKVGQMVLGFEKRDAPLHLQRRMQKPPRPWQATGEKNSGSSSRGGYSTKPYQPWDPKGPYTAPSSSWSGNNQTGGGSWSNWGGSGWDNSSRMQGNSSGYDGGGRSSTGNARSVMEPASKKTKGPSEEDTLRVGRFLGGGGQRNTATNRQTRQSPAPGINEQKPYNYF